MTMRQLVLYLEVSDYGYETASFVFRSVSDYGYEAHCFVLGV